MPRTRTDITELYAPQFEQFGIELEGRGAVFTGEVDNGVGSGRAWIMPVSPSCLVMEHFITPKKDMELLEVTPEPYACVSEISRPTLECMPEAGIEPSNLKPLRGPWSQDSVCSFIQDNCGEELSPLFSGKLYHSRSILFLPRFFDELEGRYPGEFPGLFQAFAEPWGEEAVSAICRALRQISEGRARAAGAHLYARGVVETMVAELALARSSEREASQLAGTRAAGRLVEEATACIERSLDQGRRISVDELASLLYVSRSKLCATFKSQTGEALGAYVRRRRTERAEDLLGDGSISIAQVAERLGYPQQAAFAQAFRSMEGMSPSEWRARRLG